MSDTNTMASEVQPEKKVAFANRKYSNEEKIKKEEQERIENLTQTVSTSVWTTTEIMNISGVLQELQPGRDPIPIWVQIICRKPKINW